MLTRLIHSASGLMATIGTVTAIDMVELATPDGAAHYEMYGDGYFYDLAPYLYNVLKAGCGVVYSQTIYRVDLMTKMSCHQLGAWQNFMIEHITLCKTYGQAINIEIESCLTKVVNCTFNAAMEAYDRSQQQERLLEEAKIQQWYASTLTGATYLALGLGLFATGYAGYRAYKRYTYVPNFEERLENSGYTGHIDQDFLCPISQGIMNDPVLAEDGQMYDRNNLIRWLARHPTSPITRAPIDRRKLKANPELKQKIETFVSTEEKKQNHLKLQ